MWWFFVRDFYRAGEGSSPMVSHKETPTTAFAKSTASYSPHNAEQFATYSGTPLASITAATVLEEPKGGSLSSYLQRLSVEGEQAFGLWDSDTGFSVFSANFERITQLSSAQCAGHDWIASIHHQHQYALNEALLNAETEGRSAQCLVQARADDEAQWCWLLIDVKPPTPRQHAVMVLLRNITEQCAMEEALKQTEAALAVSERGRSAFLSSMSHELRTPLNAIMGFSEMMKSGVFGPLDNKTYQQYAEHIHDSGKLLLNKVADLLDIASMDAGQMDMEESECNARELLREVMEMHSHDAFEHSQNLKLDCTHTITLMGDRAKLVCVLSHFLSNALRHSPEGEEVILSARAVAHDGIILSVRDNGEGIAPRQLDIIRSALQADNAYMNMEPGGIGLGLSLSRELAARHGGRVMVDSIRHRGTVVSLILPEERLLSGLPQKNRRSL